MPSYSSSVGVNIIPNFLQIKFDKDAEKKCAAMCSLNIEKMDRVVMNLNIV